MLALLASCDLREGFCLDYDNWNFNNHTDQHVQITPLYAGKGGVARVVPRHGWQQTEFDLEPGATLTINLETGDFPFDRLLVESARRSWTIPVQTTPVDIVATGSPSTPEQHSAKLQPSIRRAKAYLVAAAIPLLWTVPFLLVAELFARRRRAQQVASVE